MRRLITLAFATLLLTGATALAQPVPCGYVGDPPAPWFVEDGDGNPQPCPPDPGTAPTPEPPPPPPPPDYPARQILIPINP